MTYIYKITNNKNGKVYIGQTRKTLEERFKTHIQDMTRERCKHRPLYAAMIKHGVSNFSIKAIEDCDDCRSDEREKFWIDYYDSCNTGYNIALGGAGKPLYKHTEIYNLLLAGYSVNDIVLKYSCSVDIIRAIARRYNIEITSRGRGFQNFLSMSKPVLCINKEDNSDLVFKSVADAARYIKSNINCASALSGMRSHIADCCNGKRSSAYGYTFQYI